MTLHIRDCAQWGENGIDKGADGSILDLVSMYESYSNAKDALVREQFDLIGRHRASTFSCRTVVPRLSDCSEGAPLSKPPIKMCTEKGYLPFEKFRMITMVRRATTPELPLVPTSALLDTRDDEDLDRIGQLDQEISGVNSVLSGLETAILEKTPKTPEEATEKLQFVAMLLTESKEMDADFLSYVLSECCLTMRP